MIRVILERDLRQILIRVNLEREGRFRVSAGKMAHVRPGSAASWTKRAVREVLPKGAVHERWCANFCREEPCVNAGA